MTSVREITCYANRLSATAYKWDTRSVLFRTRDNTPMFRVSSIAWPEVSEYSQLTVYSHDLKYFSTESGHFGMIRQLHNADRGEIIQEMARLFHFTLRQLWECFEHATERKLIKHKRPRKRVKRFGFD